MTYLPNGNQPQQGPSVFELQQRQRLLGGMVAQQQPDDFGSGLSALGQALAYRHLSGQIGAQQAAQPPAPVPPQADPGVMGMPGGYAAGSKFGGLGGLGGYVK